VKVLAVQRRVMAVISALGLCLLVDLPVLGGTRYAVELAVGDYQALLERKAEMQRGDTNASSSYRTLIERADRALKQKIVTVVHKKSVPPSGDKHDYMSQAPYWWPDPQQPDGLPYIRHDGKVNPESRGAYLAWLLTSEKGRRESSRLNNHATWYDVQVTEILLFLGRRAEARERLEKVTTQRIATQIEPDGRQPHELARTKSLSYSKMNLSAFKRLANLGQKVGVDLWGYETEDGRSIRKAQDFLAPYLRKQKPWQYKQLGMTDGKGDHLMSANEKYYQRVLDIEKPRILRKASAYLEAAPRTVTADRCARSRGGVHDFYSEGDYWWPDPNKPNGPFIRRDGETYPGLFVAHRQSMVRLSDIIGTLASAYRLTQDARYVTQAVKHLKAWFVDPDTRMNPNLLYGQAIMGRSTGRSIGIIDTLHLTEVARGTQILRVSSDFAQADQNAVESWFRAYLTWINTHPYGKKEKVHPNNHGVCWSMQAAAFADLVGDEEILAWIRDQYKRVYLPGMMDSKGGFPAELKRTKPYGYSLFVIDAMAGVAQIASSPQEDLWHFALPDGRSMQRGLDFIVPYIRDKSTWPYRQDVLYWDQWPVRQPCLLLAGVAFERSDYLDLWESLDADPETFEVLRNLPLRHPLLWVDSR
jgi:hypothetical protein